MEIDLGTVASSIALSGVCVFVFATLDAVGSFCVEV